MSTTTTTTTTTTRDRGDRYGPMEWAQQINSYCSARKGAFISRISFHLTSFRLNWVCCDWSQSRWTQSKFTLHDPVCCGCDQSFITANSVQTRRSVWYRHCWSAQPTSNSPWMMASDRMAPVLVPPIQSKQFLIGCPATCSIACSSWISIIPRMPPPSRHRTWPPDIKYHYHLLPVLL